MVGLIPYFINAQELTNHLKHPDSENKGYIAMVMGHSLIPAGEHLDVENKGLLIPTWGIDLGLLMAPKWGLVWSNEVQLQQYEIENESVGTLQRKNPVITAFELQYLITHRLVVLAGPGVELEKEKSFFVFRFGAEMDFLISDKWAFVPSLFYETKEGKFGAFTLGIGIARGF